MFVIDLDETVFDSRGFIDFFIDFFSNTGRNTKMLLENMNHSKVVNNGLFDFKRRLNKCGIREQEFDIVRQNARHFLYDDFVTFCKKNKDQKIILTYGDKYFQQKKILHSGVRDLVDGHIVTASSDKMEELKKIYKKYKQKIFYIDNKIFLSEKDFNFDIEIFKINRLGSGKVKDFSVF